MPSKKQGREDRNHAKVFGIGWAKTGTTTLGSCFRLLGLRHASQRLDLVSAMQEGDSARIHSVVDEHDSFEDWPWILLYSQLDQAYRASRFVLTVRDDERWLRSYRGMLAREGSPSSELNEVRRVLYGLPFPDVTDEQLLSRYRAHNDRVLEYFNHRQNALLVVDWERGDGWSELCDFLGASPPGVPFPHENRGTKHPRSPIPNSSSA